MDEKFDKLINGMFPNQNQYREKLLNRELQIPGFHITVDGKDVRDILDSKGFSAFVEQDAARAQIEPNSLLNNPAILDKEKLLTYFNGYPNDVEEYFQFNISIIHQIISSMVDLIPTELNGEEKRIAQSCLDFSKMISIGLTRVIESIQGFLSNDEKDESLNDLTKLNMLRMHKNCLVHGFVELNFTIIYIMWYRQHVYDYFYGPQETKANSASKILNIESKLSNLEKYMEQIAKITEQAFTEKKTANDSLKGIKENQREIKELVKNRNELDAEKTGTLSVEECVVIIGILTKHYVELKRRDCKNVGFPPQTVKMPKEGTIRRNIEFWDQYQKGNKAKGRKPPRKDYSRNMSKEDFGKWYNKILLDDYNKWKARYRIDALSGRPTKRFGDK